MERDTLKRLVYIAVAVVVVAGAAAGLVALLGGISGRAGTGPGARTGFEVNQAESASLDGIGRVTVSAVSTPVTVIEATDGRLTARLHGTVRASREDAVAKLVVRSAGGTVEVRVEHPPVFMGFSFNPDLRLEVALPRSYAKALSVSTVSGSLEMPDWTLGELELATTSGRVEVGSVKAAVCSIHSVSGRLAARGIEAASARLATTSGSVTAAGLTGAVNATSVSGRIELGWAALNGPVDVASTSGRVELRLPAASSFRLDASSTSGSLQCDFPVTVQGAAAGQRAHSLAGTVGGGAQELRIRTVSGAIRVLQGS
jgi:lia operon protein LiaG